MGHGAAVYPVLAFSKLVAQRKSDLTNSRHFWAARRFFLFFGDFFFDGVICVGVLTSAAWSEPQSECSEDTSVVVASDKSLSPRDMSLESSSSSSWPSPCPSYERFKFRSNFGISLEIKWDSNHGSEANQIETEMFCWLCIVIIDAKKPWNE